MFDVQRPALIELVQRATLVNGELAVVPLRQLEMQDTGDPEPVVVVIVAAPPIPGGETIDFRFELRLPDGRFARPSPAPPRRWPGWFKELVVVPTWVVYKPVISLYSSSRRGTTMRTPSARNRSGNS